MIRTPIVKANNSLRRKKRNSNQQKKVKGIITVFEISMITIKTIFNKKVKLKMNKIKYKKRKKLRRLKGKIVLPVILIEINQFQFGFNFII